jgi:hypothetical protein
MKIVMKIIKDDRKRLENISIKNFIPFLLKSDISLKRHRKLARAFSDLVGLLRSGPFEDFDTSFTERKEKKVNILLII